MPDINIVITEDAVMLLYYLCFVFGMVMVANGVWYVGAALVKVLWNLWMARRERNALPERSRLP